MKAVIRRLMMVCLPALAVMLAIQPAIARQITDVRGRIVTVPDHVKTLSIDDGRFLLALALIEDAPVARLAAWPHDIKRLGKPLYQAFIKQFPDLASLPEVASSAHAFNMETLLAVAPDVAILSLTSPVTDAQVTQLQTAGIPVVFIDFYTDPARNQARSLRILGKLTGHLAKADAYIAFRQKHLQTIVERVATLPADDRPTVFMEAHAGMTRDCCNSPGKGSVNEYITLAGGHNIGADVLETATGKLNLEYVMARDPDIYIATGGSHLAATGGLVLGAGYNAAEARKSLEAVTQRKGIAWLTAVKDGRAYGLAHQLLNSPIDIVAIEALAKWIHPDLFGDIDPAATLADINRRFLTVPYRGTGWISLP